MEEKLNIRNLAKKVVDLSTIGFDLGFPFNNCGNFSLLPMPDGNWLCSMRVFGYYISGETHAYLTTPNMKL